MKTASVERIIQISPILNADKLEKLKILGYQVVVKKNEFKQNDLCIYVAVDSILPEKPEFEFLRNKHFRIRTVRFRGEISQGICFPLSILPKDIIPVEGLDVSESLECKHFEKEIFAQLAGTVKGNFPSFLRKTDELNIRSYPAAINEFLGKEVYITQKMDGSSATFYLKDGVFGVCSRNLELKPDENNSLWKIARQYKIEEALRDAQSNYGDLCIQGELAGSGIQGNKAKLSEVSFFAFNLFSITHYKYLDFSTLNSFCINYSIPMVKVIYTGIFNFTLDELVELANQQEYSPGNCSEGIVIRSQVEQKSEVLEGRLSGKIISEKFCLKYNE